MHTDVVKCLRNKKHAGTLPVGLFLPVPWEGVWSGRKELEWALSAWFGDPGPLIASSAPRDSISLSEINADFSNDISMLVLSMLV